MEGYWVKLLLVAAALFFFGAVSGETDPTDFTVLDAFRNGVDNPKLLSWPSNGSDPCGGRWPHVFCSGGRVTQIQVQGIGLSGRLPESFNRLSMLTNIGLQRNNFTGKLPSFAGLSNLQYAYLDSNRFNTTPAGFFSGLTSLQVLSLDRNPLNQSSGGWSLPLELHNSAELTNLSLIDCGIVGEMPEFLGGMSSLTALKLSYNSLSGGIRASFSGSALQVLWLNNQAGAGLSGSIDVIASMVSLNEAWLNGNSFSGMVPMNLTDLPEMQSLHLESNMLMGPIPKLGFKDFTFSVNYFCQSDPGILCSPEVAVLLEFLRGVDYPPILMASWSGNDPCSSSWLGISCIDNRVSGINLSNLGLNGSISPSVGRLDSLVDIRLERNNLNGSIPESLTGLKSLKILNVSGNNLEPPIPEFSNSVTILTDGKLLLESSSPPMLSPPGTSVPSRHSPSPFGDDHPSRPNGNANIITQFTDPSRQKLLIIELPFIGGLVILFLAVLFLCCQCKGKGVAFASATPAIVYPTGSFSPENMVKVVVADHASNSLYGNNIHSRDINVTMTTHTENGNFVASIQVLRSATENFASKNEIGRGGFGVVYKGELHDGTMITVKRMEAAVTSNTASNEFQAEIAVLSKFRHRNLVSLLGYSIEGHERILVYEYMPQGALSKHLFHWKELNLEPLTWNTRLNIALDIARGIEHLHSFAHSCFIHRDLKSSNILLCDNYRAKVSDFGLAKLARDEKDAVVTRVAGTFGYLAPEYAVTGKITTKADVYSFGIVLMELVTGLKALDENRHEESRYLASWFSGVLSSKKLMDVVDASLDVTGEILDSISIIAELAGHCAARELYQRPDMGHAVNVLAPLVEKWKPISDDQEEFFGIDIGQPLLQMVKGWQAAEGTYVTSAGLDDSKRSIPARPSAFADSFTSADGR